MKKIFDIKDLRGYIASFIGWHNSFTNNKNLLQLVNNLNDQDTREAKISKREFEYLTKIIIDNDKYNNYKKLPEIISFKFAHAFHNAVKAQNMQQVESLLLNEKININTTDKYNCTLLMKAIELKNVKLVKLLLAEGADPNMAKNFYDSPLLKAIEVNQEEIVLLLIKYNAKTNYFTSFKQPPLLAKALQNGMLKAAEQLILAGADTKLKINHRVITGCHTERYHNLFGHHTKQILTYADTKKTMDEYAEIGNCLNEYKALKLKLGLK
jgi:hypothetical protein